jgi:hypothetical protein
VCAFTWSTIAVPVAVAHRRIECRTLPEDLQVRVDGGWRHAGCGEDGAQLARVVGVPAVCHLTIHRTVVPRSRRLFRVQVERPGERGRVRP